MVKQRLEDLADELRTVDDAVEVKPRKGEYPADVFASPRTLAIKGILDISIADLESNTSFHVGTGRAMSWSMDGQRLAVADLDGDTGIYVVGSNAFERILDPASYNHFDVVGMKWTQEGIIVVTRSKTGKTIYKVFCALVDQPQTRVEEIISSSEVISDFSISREGILAHRDFHNATVFDLRSGIHDTLRDVVYVECTDYGSTVAYEHPGESCIHFMDFHKETEPSQSLSPLLIPRPLILPLPEDQVFIGRAISCRKEILLHNAGSPPGGGQFKDTDQVSGALFRRKLAGYTRINLQFPFQNKLFRHMNAAWIPDGSAFIAQVVVCPKNDGDYFSHLLLYHPDRDKILQRLSVHKYFESMDIKPTYRLA